MGWPARSRYVQCGFMIYLQVTIIEMYLEASGQKTLMLI